MRIRANLRQTALKILLQCLLAKIHPRNFMCGAIKCCKHPVIYICKASSTLPKGKLSNDETEIRKKKPSMCAKFKSKNYANAREKREIENVSQ